MALPSRSEKAISGNRVKWRQITKWLPNEVNDGEVHYRLDDDVSAWVEHYERIGRRFEIRRRRGYQLAVFVQVG